MPDEYEVFICPPVMLMLLNIHWIGSFSEYMWMDEFKDEH